MQHSDTARDSAPADDFLPVGMLNNGHASVQMMQAIAMRKHGGADWEPFHYEKISANEFELTGAVPLVTGNTRKWLEPHTTVIVSEEEIAQGLREAAAASLPSTAADTEPSYRDAAVVAPAAAPPSPQGHGPASAADVDLDATHMVVTLRLPADVQGRRRLLAALGVGSDFFGATVTASVTGKDGAAR